MIFQVKRVFTEEPEPCPNCNWKSSEFFEVQQKEMCPSCFFNFCDVGTKIEVV